MTFEEFKMTLFVMGYTLDSGTHSWKCIFTSPTGKFNIGVNHKGDPYIHAHMNQHYDFESCIKRITELHTTSGGSCE